MILIIFLIKIFNSCNFKIKHSNKIAICEIYFVRAIYNFKHLKEKVKKIKRNTIIRIDNLKIKIH